MQVKVLSIAGGEDLSDFAAYLWQHKIPHRIRFHEGQQELWLMDSRYAGFVEQQYLAWSQGGVLDNGALANTAVKRPRSPSLVTLISHSPIIVSLIVAALVISFFTGFGTYTNPLFHWLTFVDFRVQGATPVGQSLSTMIESGQLWRWFSPALLHFSLLHLVFNLLWIWELGRRIERAYQPLVTVWLVLFIAVVSNAAQFLLTGPMFGGLSGVVYGFIGFTFLWDRISSERRFGLPPMLMTFMLVWLVVGISGLLEHLGFPGMANGAHLVGLICGLLAVPVVYVWRTHLWRR